MQALYQMNHQALINVTPEVYGLQLLIGSS